MNDCLEHPAGPETLAAGRTESGTAAAAGTALPASRRSMPDHAAVVPFPATAENGQSAPTLGPNASRRLRRRHDLVLACTALACGLSRRALVHAGRGRPEAILARHMAMYLMHVIFAVPMPEVARLFRRDRSTVAYACRRIEEDREDARFDAFMHDLELAISTLDSAMQMHPEIGTKHEY